MIIPFSYDTVPPWTAPTPLICKYLSFLHKSSTLPVQLWGSFLSNALSYSDSVPVYTDGSKSEDVVGCAAVFLHTHLRCWPLSFPGRFQIITGGWLTIIRRALNTLQCEAPTHTLCYSPRTPIPTETNPSTTTTTFPFSLEHLKQITIYHSLNPKSTQAPYFPLSPHV